MGAAANADKDGARGKGDEGGLGWMDEYFVFSGGNILMR